MEHHFNVKIAQEYGIEEAILIHYFHYWVYKNAANEKHCHENTYWTYNSKRAFAELFPYMNETKIGRVIKNLEEKQIIKKNKFSEDKWDRTNWYAFTQNGITILRNFGYDTALLQNGTMDGCKTTQCACDSSINNNNIDLKLQLEDTIKEKESKEKSDALFEECWVAYRRKSESKKKSKEYWNKLTDDEKSLVLPHIKAYVSTRELSFQKDFVRYLRDKIFNSIVTSGNSVVYDPSRGTTSEYHPATDGDIRWNDKNKCYLFVGMFFGTVYDGYTNENRPDGATVVLNNGQGTITWNSKTKVWEKK